MASQSDPPPSPLPLETGLAPLSDADYERFRRFIHDAAGIVLGDGRKTLVSTRLGPRLRALGLSDFGHYLALLQRGAQAPEVQVAVDLLTTNETYFFREAEHFALLRSEVAAGAQRPSLWRVWSAACSSGEEAWSTAMVLEDVLNGRPWEVVGTDISRRVVDRARKAVYPMQRMDFFPPGYLRRFCLKGKDDNEGKFRVAPELHPRVRFEYANLVDGVLPPMGQFDVVFLRNVMIYFDFDTRCRVVEHVLRRLKFGGLLLLSHTEVLARPVPGLKQEAPSVYRWTGPAA